MKTTLLKNTLLIATLAFSTLAFAQTTNNNLVVFSQDGDKFSLIVNGLRQNEKPETNVKVTGLNADNYKVRVIFENGQIAPIDQTVYMMDGGEKVTNKEFTYAIAMGKKGLKLKPQSVADITPQGAAAPGQVIYVFNPSGNATSYSTTTTTSGTSSNTGVVVVPNNAGAQTTTTVNDGSGGTNSTTTTTTTTGGTSDNINVGMNTGGVGVGININVNDGMGGTSTSTTTTTTSSSTTTSGTGTTTVTPPPASNQCAWPMSSSDFANAKKSVESQSFEDKKLKVAKQILNTNCMSTAQVKEIMALFSFEDSKVDWAEFAYGKTTDFNNYYQLNDGFTFSSSVDKLNDYIDAHKR